MNIFKKLFSRRNQNNSSELDKNKSLDGTRGDIIINFKSLIQREIEWNELNPTEFAMWLPCEDDKSFSNSILTKRWTEAYNLTRFYWTFITADLLKALNLVDEETFQINLPDNLQTFAFMTSDNEQIILSLSKEKGIRFHFSETTSTKYKINFMEQFITYCKAWNELIELNEGKKDNDIGFADWWESIKKVSIEVEQREPLTGVGKIVK